MSKKTRIDIEILKQLLRDRMAIDFKERLLPGGRVLDSVCMICGNVIVSRFLPHDALGLEGLEDADAMGRHRDVCKGETKS